MRRRRAGIGPARRLQRLAEDRIVEAGVGIVGEVGIGVALHHRQSPRHRRSDIARIELEPARIALALVAQRRHQRAVAAADIEHAAARRHVGRDDREVRAQAHRW
jgi:hypothetical protein